MALSKIIILKRMNVAYRIIDNVRKYFVVVAVTQYLKMFKYTKNSKINKTMATINK